MLHLSEDILDHGVPENVNSAYTESAHIPLTKVTARNTQKRAAIFTKQAAQRYVENMSISSAKYDMEQDDLTGCIAPADNSNAGGRGSLGDEGSQSRGQLGTFVRSSVGSVDPQEMIPTQTPCRGR